MSRQNIIIRSDYKLSLSNVDRHKRNIDSDKRIVNNLLNYYADDKKRILNMLDYFTGKINKNEDINLVLEDGHYATQEEYENRKKYIDKQFKKSNVWRMVLSIDKDLVDNNISWRELELKLAKEILPKFFKKMGFEDTKKMCYQFSLHTNTSHPHFHIAFLERSPNTLNQKNELMYRRKGEIPLNAIKFLMNETTLTIERNNKFNPIAISINDEIDDLKKYFNPKEKNFVLYDKKNVLLEEKILTLGKLLDKVRTTCKRIKYSSIIDEEIKRLTQEIKDEIFIRSNKLNISRSEFNKKIKDMDNYLINVSKRNSINLKDIDLSYTKNKEKYLNNYILNSIVNYANYHYEKESKKVLRKDDVIRTIILNIYNKHKKLSRKQIVVNSFSNNYVLTNEFKNAIRNINKELEEAAEEFYKMNYKI